MLPFDCMSIFLSYSGSALCSSTTCAARMAALGRLHCFRFFISVASPRKHIPSRPSGGPVCSSSAVCVCWATSTCISEWQHSGCLRPQTTSIGGATLASDVYYANNKQGNGFHIPSPPPARPAWGGVFSEHFPIFVINIVKWLLGAFQNEIIRPQLVSGFSVDYRCLHFFFAVPLVMTILLQRNQSHMDILAHGHKIN